MRIPVFNRPTAAGHALYLFQYPLRPRWRRNGPSPIVCIRPAEGLVIVLLYPDPDFLEFREHKRHVDCSESHIADPGRLRMAAPAEMPGHHTNDERVVAHPCKVRLELLYDDFR